MGITLQWPGGEHEFALSIGHLRAVQDACDAGPMEIYAALRSGSWRVDMPMAVIRYGLIGGGMAADEAKALVSRMFDAHPLAMFITPATLVIMAAVVGPGDDPVGEPEGETTTSPENGSSRPSTGAGRKRGSPRAKSTK